MILSARVARLWQGAHSWSRPQESHRFVASENALLECVASSCAALLTLFLDPREVFKKKILRYTVRALSEQILLFEPCSHRYVCAPEAVNA
jgi:hypothetical protein